MKVTVIPVIFGAIATIPKNLEKRMGEIEIRERIQADQTTALMKLVRILKEVQEY